MKAINTFFTDAQTEKKSNCLILLLVLFFYVQTSFAQTWIPLNTGVSQDLKCLHFLDSQIGFAAGENGTIIKTQDGGANWDSLITNATATFRTIFFLDQNLGWAAGDNGTIIKTTDGGTNWNTQLSGSSSFTITNIYFSDANNGIFTASGPTIKKSTNGGTLWNTTGITSSGMTGSIWGFDALSANEFWLSGSAHTINHTTTSCSSWAGVNSTFIAPPVLNGTTIFQDIDFIDPTHGWTVGGQGAIYYTTTGATTAWNTIGAPPVSSELLSVDILDGQTGWACGRTGTIVFTSGTNGMSWAAQASGTSQNLWEVDFVNATTGFVAGDAGTLLKYGNISSSSPITVLQPNGNEDYKVATSQSIIWYSNAISNVKIEYSLDNGSNWTTISNSYPSGTGSISYTWNVPNNISCNALVRITNASNASVGDTSDAIFTISPVYVGNDHSVEVTATSSNSPAKIQLNWNFDPYSNGYAIDRKLKTDTTWNNIASISSSATNYIDNTVAVGDAYEYRVTNNNCMLTSYGYIYAGLELPETDFRGSILLLVDQNHFVGISNVDIVKKQE